MCPTRVVVMGPMTRPVSVAMVPSALAAVGLQVVLADGPTMSVTCAPDHRTAKPEKEPEVCGTSREPKTAAPSREMVEARKGTGAIWNPEVRVQRKAWGVLAASKRLPTMTRPSPETATASRSDQPPAGSSSSAKVAGAAPATDASIEERVEESTKRRRLMRLLPRCSADREDGAVSLAGARPRVHEHGV
jgi:hypothetical protein